MNLRATPISYLIELVRPNIIEDTFSSSVCASCFEALLQYIENANSVLGLPFAPMPGGALQMYLDSTH